VSTSRSGASAPATTFSARPSLRALDGLRDRITEDLARLNPELDVSVLFRSARG
jgi:hypothetical protein